MQIVIAPDQRLRVKTKPVKKITPELLKTIKNMIKLTRSHTDPKGIGLASTQIGKSEQYFIAEKKDGTFKTIFNPRILNYSKKTKVFFEGCLSIPNFWGEVTRPIAVTVTFTDESGKEVKQHLIGLDAWIFQHEYDHLQGKLLIDHVLEQKSRLFKVIGRDRAGSEVFEEVKL